jgi:hypothetical protein
MRNQPPDPIQDDADYKSKFLATLNNLGKLNGTEKARVRGFVVIARGGRSLKPLQELCFDTKQTYNTCLTGRYRLQPGAVVGTLLASFFMGPGTDSYWKQRYPGGLGPSSQR